MKYTKKRKTKNNLRKTRKSYRGGESSYIKYKILYDKDVFVYRSGELQVIEPHYNRNNYVAKLLTATPKQCIIMFPKKDFAFTNYWVRPNKIYSKVLGKKKRFADDRAIDEILRSRIQNIISGNAEDTDTPLYDKVKNNLFIDEQIKFLEDPKVKRNICHITNRNIFDLTNNIYSDNSTGYSLYPNIFIVNDTKTWNICLKQNSIVDVDDETSIRRFDTNPYIDFIYLQCSKADIDNLIRDTIESNKTPRMIIEHNTRIKKLKSKSLPNVNASKLYDVISESYPHYTTKPTSNTSKSHIKPKGEEKKNDTSDMIHLADIQLDDDDDGSRSPSLIIHKKPSPHRGGF